jgi:hypothetical protein
MQDFETSFMKKYIIKIFFLVLAHHLYAAENVFPSAADIPNQNWGMSVEGDFLYWLPKQSGLEFASVFVGETGKVQEAPSHFEPGYQVKTIFFPHFDGADLTFGFTWLNQPGRLKKFQKNTDITCENNPNQDICFIVGDGYGFYPDDFILLSEIETAKASWSYVFSQGDIAMGKRYKLSDRFQLRPFFGVTFMWQHQDFKLLYEMEDFDMTQSIDCEQRSFGIGPKVGGDIKFRFNSRFSFLASTSCSLLSTRFKSSSKEFTTLFDEPSADYDLFNRITQIQPIYDLYLGIDFDRYYEDNSYLLNFGLGWQFRYFFGNNQLVVNPDDYRQGDLSLQGLTFKARFGF